ncbi:MAG: quinate 5-dehydrogenase [Firmicutes bacterium]|nr:quinate 5-dehydrogenase [Bacillota bacterium]
MKKVVSISLGSSRRDHEAVLYLQGTRVQVARYGADGDMTRAEQMIAAADGQVDAIGLGGIDRYLWIGADSFEIADAAKLAASAQKTPVVDGSYIKMLWEPQVIHQLAAEGVIHSGQSVLMVSALDRFGMADAFYRENLSVICGDLIFSSRMDYPIRDLDELEEIGRKILPGLLKLPFQQLYPTGSDQDTIVDGIAAPYFAQADIIAGDFHFIRRTLPPDLHGKTIITNTTTQQDREILRQRGAQQLITTTPILSGRSFGTNVLEAALIAANHVPQDGSDWRHMIEQAGFEYAREVFSA